MDTDVTNEPILNNIIKLHFNDNIDILLSTSSFIYKNSVFLQSFDINEDNVIPMLCPSFCVTNENKRFYENCTHQESCYFNDKTDLFFMFTLPNNKFLNLCKFFDIIHYDNNDTKFSKQFIKYVMKYLNDDIQVIKYFMQYEIKSIMNYLNNINIDIQVKNCTPIFYTLYLTKYKEEVIKHNRIDIFDLLQNKDEDDEYYRYVYKYNNKLTHKIKQTKCYEIHVQRISSQLLNECDLRPSNFNKIKSLVEQGADVNCHSNRESHYDSVLHNASNNTNNIEIIHYLIEQGANVNYQNENGDSALHYASTLNVVQYLIEHGANVKLKDRNGNTALHAACSRPINVEVIKCLISYGADINIKNNGGQNALQTAYGYSIELDYHMSRYNINIDNERKLNDETIKYLKLLTTILNNNK